MQLNTLFLNHRGRETKVLNVRKTSTTDFVGLHYNHGLLNHSVIAYKALRVFLMWGLIAMIAFLHDLLV